MPNQVDYPASVIAVLKIGLWAIASLDRNG
jgi:hypothetical protein